MSRPAKGPRLYCRRDRGIWIIRDTGRPDYSTGTRNRGEAEKCLAAYLAQRDRRGGGPAAVEDITIDEVLSIYGVEHAPTCADPVRIGNAIQALTEFWGSLPVSAITGSTCRRYAASRFKRGPVDPDTGEPGPPVPIAPGTIRRELGALRAALRYCYSEGYILAAPAVKLPDRTPPKDRWLTRSEAARLLWATRKSDFARHLARFILVGLYTGSRKTTILNLQFVPNTSGGWLDVESGRIHRAGTSQRRTKKLQPPAPMPRQLLAHARRWAKQGDRFVVSEETPEQRELRKKRKSKSRRKAPAASNGSRRGGNRVSSIKTSWAHAAKAAGLPEITPHVLRHTAITWAMQRGADPWQVAGFFGVSQEVITSTYGHHHPDFMESARAALERR